MSQKGSRIWLFVVRFDTEFQYPLWSRSPPRPSDATNDAASGYAQSSAGWQQPVCHSLKIMGSNLHEITGQFAMKRNVVRDKLLAGETSVGCFLGLASPSVAELMAHAGFDWLMIETEHNAVDLADVQHMLMAIGCTNAVPMVRLPSADPTHIQRTLDIGAKASWCQ